MNSSQKVFRWISPSSQSLSKGFSIQTIWEFLTRKRLEILDLPSGSKADCVDDTCPPWTHLHLFDFSESKVFLGLDCSFIPVICSCCFRFLVFYQTGNVNAASPAVCNATPKTSWMHHITKCGFKTCCNLSSFRESVSLWQYYLTYLTFRTYSDHFFTLCCSLKPTDTEVFRSFTVMLEVLHWFFWKFLCSSVSIRLLVTSYSSPLMARRVLVLPNFLYLRILEVISVQQKWFVTSTQSCLGSAGSLLLIWLQSRCRNISKKLNFKCFSKQSEYFCQCDISVFLLFNTFA